MEMQGTTKTEVTRSTKAGRRHRAEASAAHHACGACKGTAAGADPEGGSSRFDRASICQRTLGKAAGGGFPGGAVLQRHLQQKLCATSGLAHPSCSSCSAACVNSWRLQRPAATWSWELPGNQQSRSASPVHLPNNQQSRSDSRAEAHHDDGISGHTDEAHHRAHG